MSAPPRRAILFFLILGYALSAGVLLKAAEILVPGDYAGIQLAIAAASDGDTILVWPGTYFENLDFGGKSIVVEGLNGSSSTIIDGGATSGAVARFDSGESNQAVLRGFTLRQGTGHASLLGPLLGGGLYIQSSSPTVEYCVIENNAAADGGGVYIGGVFSLPVFRFCEFRDNAADFTGGGARVAGVQNVATFSNCVFDSNQALSGGGLWVSGVVFLESCILKNHDVPIDGGALSVVGGVAELQRCRLSDNGAESGGAILVAGGEVIAEHCCFWDNVAEQAGGAVFVWTASSYLSLEFCTLYSNQASSSAGGVSVAAAAVVDLANSIFWDNDLAQIDGVAAAAIDCRFSDVMGGYPGLEIFDANPMFIDATSADFGLEQASPCIDAGDPAELEDPDGTPADIGAYYRPATVSPFVRGDCNSDDMVNIGDPVFALFFLFGGTPGTCVDACDLNDDGLFDVADVVGSLGALFEVGAPPIPAPHPDCGADPTADGIFCSAAGCP